MPRKSNTKKSKSTPAKKVNKSAWIRNQPGGMSASEVVDKAKAEGITVTANQVYTARSTAKSSKGTKRSKGKKPAAVGGNPEQVIRRLALTVGIAQVEALVKKIRTEAGL